MSNTGKTFSISAFPGLSVQKTVGLKPGDTVTLRSNDGQIKELPFRAAQMSQTLGNMLEDLQEDDRAIPIDVASGDILELVIRYCLEHTDTDPPRTPDDLNAWDKLFVASIDQVETLIALIKAADFLVIDSLRDLVINRVAGMIRGRTPAEIYTFFGYDPEQDE